MIQEFLGKCRVWINKTEIFYVIEKEWEIIFRPIARTKDIFHGC